MDLKLDLAKAVKIVIAKDENHHIVYTIDNGEIKDVNIIEIDNSPSKCCEKTISEESLKEEPVYNDRYFIDKASSLAEKIVSGRETVSRVKDAISDTSNPETLHSILGDGTTDKPLNIPEVMTQKEEEKKVNAWKDKWINEQSNKHAISMERSKKIMELVKNGAIDRKVKIMNKRA